MRFTDSESSTIMQGRPRLAMKTFTEYRDDSIRNLSAIDDLKTQERARKILAMETPVFGNLKPEDISISPPPANDDPITINELHYLSNVTINNSEEALKFIQDTDNDIMKPFLDYAWKNMMQLNKRAYQALMQQAAKFERYYKHMYLRPRPSRLAEVLGMHIEVQDSKTAHTPAYPSGHACQAMVAALAMAREYEREEKGLIRVAYKVAQARVDAGFHYPSDMDAGFEIAFQLYDNIQWDIFHDQRVQDV